MLVFLNGLWNNLQGNQQQLLNNRSLDIENSQPLPSFQQIPMQKENSFPPSAKNSNQALNVFAQSFSIGSASFYQKNKTDICELKYKNQFLKREINPQFAQSLAATQIDFSQFGQQQKQPFAVNTSLNNSLNIQNNNMQSGIFQSTSSSNGLTGNSLNSQKFSKQISLQVNQSNNYSQLSMGSIMNMGNQESFQQTNQNFLYKQPSQIFPFPQVQHQNNVFPFTQQPQLQQVSQQNSLNFMMQPELQQFVQTPTSNTSQNSANNHLSQNENFMSYFSSMMQQNQPQIDMLGSYQQQLFQQQQAGFYPGQPMNVPFSQQPGKQGKNNKKVKRNLNGGNNMEFSYNPMHMINDLIGFNEPLHPFQQAQLNGQTTHPFRDVSRVSNDYSSGDDQLKNENSFEDEDKFGLTNESLQSFITDSPFSFRNPIFYSIPRDHNTMAKQVNSIVSKRKLFKDEDLETQKIVDQPRPKLQTLLEIQNETKEQNQESHLKESNNLKEAQQAQGNNKEQLDSQTVISQVINQIILVQEILKFRNLSRVKMN